MNARNSAKARWIARASVSLSTKRLSMKGSGEAYHSWNSDQAIATQSRTLPALPAGARAPVSLCATSSCSAASSGRCSGPARWSVMVRSSRLPRRRPRSARLKTATRIHATGLQPGSRRQAHRRKERAGRATTRLRGVLVRLSPQAPAVLVPTNHSKLDRVRSPLSPNDLAEQGVENGAAAVGGSGDFCARARLHSTQREQSRLFRPAVDIHGLNPPPRSLAVMVSARSRAVHQSFDTVRRHKPCPVGPPCQSLGRTAKFSN